MATLAPPPVAPLPIPYGPEETDPHWLTRALRAGGVRTRGPVAGIRVEPMAAGHGFIGVVARLHVSYASSVTDGADGRGGAVSTEGSGGRAPATIIAKFPSADPAERRRLVGNVREVHCYRALSAAERRLLGMPEVYWAAADAATGDTVLLLEDLGGLRAGDGVAGCSFAEAMRVVTHLARFQAAWWEDDRLPLPSHSGLFPADPAVVAERYRERLPQFVAKFADRLPPAVALLSQRVEGHLPSLWRALSGPPLTLVHGDFKLDNLFFGVEDGRATVRLFDWQLALRGRGVSDLAHFMSFSLPVSERREWEDGLLAAYHATLVEDGPPGLGASYPLERCRRDYRWGIVDQLRRIVLGFAWVDTSSERAQRLTSAVLERCEALLADHDVARLLTR